MIFLAQNTVRFAVCTRPSFQLLASTSVVSYNDSNLEPIHRPSRDIKTYDRQLNCGDQQNHIKDIRLGQPQNLISA